MQSAEQWARDALEAWRAAARDDADVALGFQRRASRLFLACQEEALRECARLCTESAMALTVAGGEHGRAATLLDREQGP